MATRPEEPAGSAKRGGPLTANPDLPPTAVDVTSSIGFTPCLPRFTPQVNSLIRFGEKVYTAVPTAPAARTL